MPTCAQAAPVAMGSDAAPNKILFVQNLPAATTDAMLAMLFQQFPGYVETRMVEVRARTPSWSSFCRTYRGKTVVASDTCRIISRWHTMLPCASLCACVAAQP